MSKRAAQFAPFAALSGYDEAIGETARITSPRIELSEHEQYILSRRLDYILSHREMKISIVHSGYFLFAPTQQNPEAPTR